MLSQSNTVHPAVVSNSFRMQRTEAVWDAIEALLRRRGRATTREVADAIELSASSTQARLLELRELGEVRFGPARRGSSVRTWELGMDESVALAESMKPLLSKAVQLGIFERDPLVAALFGAQQPRCVGCHSEQGQPHASACVFGGLDIGAARRNQSCGG